MLRASESVLGSGSPRPDGGGRVPPVPGQASGGADPTPDGPRAGQPAPVPEAPSRDSDPPELPALPAGVLDALPTPHEWEAYWAPSGTAAPRLVAAPVYGKALAPGRHTGLPHALVHLITFFDGPRGVVPVTTRVLANHRGVFRATVPAPSSPPSGHPTLAVTVDLLVLTDDGTISRKVRVVHGATRATLDPGTDNSLGVFRPALPRQAYFDARRVAGRRTVAVTGGLDPRRWDPLMRGSALGTVPRASFDPIGWSLQRAFVPVPRRDTDGRAVPVALAVLFSGDDVADVEPLTVVRDDDTIRMPTVVFGEDDARDIEGTVTKADGRPLAGASLTLVDTLPPTRVLTDFDGRFIVRGVARSVRSAVVSHPDWVDEEVATDADVIDVRMGTRRPRHVFRVVDASSGDVVPRVFVAYVVAGRTAEPPALRRVELTAGDDGRMHLVAPRPLASATIEQVGYRPARLPLHAAGDEPVVVRIEQSAGLEPSVQLEPSVRLDIRPRDYTRVQWRRGWLPDKDPESPGIATLNPRLWIEWKPDFGAPPPDGVRGGAFDLVLGVNNLKRFLMIDHDFAFHVEVFVDGKRRGALDIPADTESVRYGRLHLGRLSGEHVVRLRWTNDRYVKGEFDANIRYASLRFIEVEPR